MISVFESLVPVLGPDSYVHPSADVLGNVRIGAGCWIGPGARIRGDYGRIVIGDCTAVEDNCVVHARPGEQTTIGNWVTLGHGCIVHNATVHNWAVIGMGAIVSDWADVGEWAIVAEGAVVRQRQVIAPERIAVGTPAKLLEKAITDEVKAQWRGFKQEYVNLARRYLVGLKPVEA
jgi:carbonic anhydrase/acetyltransferase-like protein (isoleucine patch superfamily)